MSIYTLIVTLAMIALVVSKHPPDISSLRITGCQCFGGSNSCSFRQIGHALRGHVTPSFDGAKIRCTETPLTNAIRTIYGWDVTCDIPSTSGRFEISYNGAQNQLCGTSFDRVTLQSCSFVGRPCSAFG
ncbi:uncharacterized protein LOC127862099 [Dreissena polymorpha]|uniref:Uncharacterized protein n=1 Tax=Dreissena polymorpha TaxID=45954 RepID=A0A9D3YE89_DREPO|nr:uncharacterized protein LOC127862099 [Dreissena polymorpha]KAH3698202.1 hypothetical protein DPMN_085721 [Dreissena polymorpha]